MTSGNEAEIILKEFNNNDYINDFIIFCHDKRKYTYLKSHYKKLKLFASYFPDILNFLKDIKHSKEDLKMDNHLLLTPLITYFEYKKGIFPIHRVMAHFFDKLNSKFNEKYFNVAKKFLIESTIENVIKQKIMRIMKKLLDCTGDDFPEKCINYYTGKNLCYAFNKALRNFEKYYVEMAYFIGPFYYVFSYIH